MCECGEINKPRSEEIKKNEEEEEYYFDLVQLLTLTTRDPQYGSLIMPAYQQFKIQIITSTSTTGTLVSAFFYCVLICKVEVSPQYI